MYRTDFWTLWEKARVGCFERTAWTLSIVKQITSPGGMHETSARAWCTGKTQRNRVERELGGGIGMGNTCNSMADSCQCMTKPTAILWNGWPPTNKNKWKKKKWSESESCSVVSDSLRPHGLHGPRNSPGQNTGVGGYSLLQGIFPTQGSNPGLPHCRRILYNKMELGKLSPLSVAEFPHLWNWDDNKTSLMVLLWLNKSIRKVLHESIPNVSQGWCYYCSSHPNSGYIRASAPLLCVKKHQIWIVTRLNIQKIFLSSLFWLL